MIAEGVTYQEEGEVIDWQTQRCRVDGNSAHQMGLAGHREL